MKMLWNIGIVLIICHVFHSVESQLSLFGLNFSIFGDVIDRNTIKLHEITNQIEGLKDLFGFSFNHAFIPPDVDAIAKMNPEEVAKYWGFDSETHTVQTEDGYILQIHRICNASMQSNGEVVYLQHGLLDTSFTWMVNSPHQSLAFILANRGFDVWMGSFRGNTYSRSHIKFNPDLPGNFWCFTIDDLGLIDLPTMLNYVLHVTKSLSMNYVGHSQGTTTILMLLSTVPEFNKKLKSLHFLAPIMDLSHTTSSSIYPFIRNLEVLRLLRCTELFKNFDAFRLLSGTACSDESTIQGGCDFGLKTILGNSINQINQTRLPIYIAHAPGGSSIGQFLHFAQFVRTGEFCHYDYGAIENTMKYNQIFPPCYPIENIRTNICIYYSDNDSLSVPKSVEILIKRLKRAKSLECMHHLKTDEAVFNHQDYIWSIHANELVYNHMIDTLEKHISSK